VPLLKIAQSDPSDEIRLYAFSRLERMRDNLETQVKEVTSSLETATGVEAARLHLRLAQSYWELGYLGLAEGAVLAHALKSAHHHAAIASETSPMHAPAEFFLGRILLHLREPERATIAFERAIRAGYPRVKVLPWLAECAFYEREFGTVTALLGELDSLSPANVFFQPVSDFWADPHASQPKPPRGSRASLRMHRFNLEQALRRSTT
jgi:tetratricopeptide (TPR) repeat protein